MRNSPHVHLSSAVDFSDNNVEADVSSWGVGRIPHSKIAKGAILEWGTLCNLIALSSPLETLRRKIHETRTN